MIIWHVDPGHAWLQVPLADYPGALAYGTGYGYWDEENVYLEEDCEAPAFLVAHPEIDPARISGRRYEDDAPLRSLPHIPTVMVVGGL
jgi:hypothetical protein